ncbi:MAG TPA: hypothetical protein VK906_06620 [Egicoccus sp.]|nr:hypothetical protein [Egicoccus sp.]HSK22829.1 hypothetical protein [Egicoccus sp.]
MIIKLREIFSRINRDQLGALSAEYVAVIIVVGLIVTALIQAGIDTKVGECAGKAVDSVFKQQEAGC